MKSSRMRGGRKQKGLTSSRYNFDLGDRVVDRLSGATDRVGQAVLATSGIRGNVSSCQYCNPTLCRQR